MALLNKSQIKKVFEIFHNLNPEPKGELDYHNNFTLLIAVILSAQATDKGVNKATAQFFPFIQGPQDIIHMGIEKLIHYIKTIGLYQSKATNIMKTCHLLVDKFNSQVPDNLEDLIKLPGCGRKTANVVLNIGFGKPTLAVDTHVFRVSNRLGLTQTSNPEKTEEALIKVIPKNFLHHAHHWLILHGRYICTARNPKCSSCPLAHLCPPNGL